MISDENIGFLSTNIIPFLESQMKILSNEKYRVSYKNISEFIDLNKLNSEKMYFETLQRRIKINLPFYQVVSFTE